MVILPALFLLLVSSSTPPPLLGNDGPRNNKFPTSFATAADIPSICDLLLHSFFSVPPSPQPRFRPFLKPSLRKVRRDASKELRDRITSRRMFVTRSGADKDAGAGSSSQGDAAGPVTGFVELRDKNFAYTRSGSLSSLTSYPCVTNLCCTPSLRRLGIASSLLGACEEKAREEGAAELYLQVEDDNEAALRLYEGRGYEAVVRDGAGRRLKVTWWGLDWVRVRMVTMRKVLGGGGGGGRKRTLNRTGEQQRFITYYNIFSCWGLISMRSP